MKWNSVYGLCKHLQIVRIYLKINQNYRSLKIEFLSVSEKFIVLELRISFFAYSSSPEAHRRLLTANMHSTIR